MHSKKKISKKVVALLLAVVMVVTSFTTDGLQAFAFSASGDTDTTVETTAETVTESADADSEYPAVDFGDVVIGDTTVSISAPEGAFQEGIQVSVTELTGDDLAAAQAAVESGDASADASAASAYDITFYYNDISEDVQPLVPVSVSFTVADSDDSYDVYHMEDGADTAEQVGEDLGTVEENGDGSVEITSDEFSVYIIVQGQKECDINAAATATGTANIYKSSNDFNDSANGSSLNVVFTAASYNLDSGSGKKNSNDPDENDATKEGDATVSFVDNNKNTLQTQYSKVYYANTDKKGNLIDYVEVTKFTVYRNSNKDKFVVRAYLSNGSCVDYVDTKGTNNSDKFYWVYESYTLNFDFNAGSDKVIGSTPGNRISYEKNVIKFYKTSFYRTGYTFTGWYTADGTLVMGPNDSEATYTFDSSKHENQTVTLYAHWTEKTTTFKYETQEGGSVSATTKTVGVVNGPTDSITATADTANGYYFDGWYVGDKKVSDDATLTATVMKQNANKTDGLYTDTTFTAHFSQKQLYITYQQGYTSLDIIQNYNGAYIQEKNIVEPYYLNDIGVTHYLRSEKINYTITIKNSKGETVDDYFSYPSQNGTYTLVVSAKGYKSYTNTFTVNISKSVNEISVNYNSVSVVDNVKKVVSSIISNGKTNDYKVTYALGSRSNTLGKDITVSVPDEAKDYIDVSFPELSNADNDHQIPRYLTIKAKNVTKDTDKTFTITATSKEDDNYTSDTVLFTVTVKNGTINVTSAKAKDLTYTGSAQQLIDSSSDDANGTISYQLLDSNKNTLVDWTTDVSKIAATNAGTYTINYKDEKAGYTTVTGSLTAEIKKADGSYTEEPAAKELTYKGEAQELVSTGTSETGTVYYKLGDGEWSTSVPTAKAAGSYTVYYYVKGDANHNDTAVSSTTVQIAQKVITASLDQTSFTYDGTEKTVTPSLSGVEEGDEVSLTYTADSNKATNAGDYSVSNIALTGANAANYSLSNEYASLSWSIAQRTLADGDIALSTIADRTYTGSLITVDDLLTVKVTMEGKEYTLTKGSDYELSYSSNLDAGTATVTVNFKGNFTNTYKNTSFNILKAAGSVSVPTAASLIYNGEAQELLSAVASSSTGTVEYSLDGTKWSEKVPTATNVGSYTVYYRVVGDANHENVDAAYVTAEIVKADGLLTISPANATLVDKILQLVYGTDTASYSIDTNKSGGKVTASLSTNVEGVEASDMLSVEISGNTVILKPGTRDGLVSVELTSAGGDNYKDAYATIDVNVKNGTLSYSAVSESTVTYDGEAHTISVTADDATDGNSPKIEYALVGEDGKTGEYSETQPEMIDAGSYRVAYRITLAGYETVTGTSDLIIGRAADSVSMVEDASYGKTYDGEAIADPDKNFYSVLSDDYNEEDKTASFHYTGTTYAGEDYDSDEAPTEAGEYTVTIAVAQDNNFEAASMDYAFTIDRAEGSFDLSDLSTVTYPVSEQVTVSNHISDGEITVASSDEDVATATIEDGVITIMPGTTAGTATISVISAETANYAEVTKTIEVTVENGTFVATGANYTGIYDGTAHSASVASALEGASIAYGMTEGTYDLTEMPEFTEAGTYTVYYQVTAAGYITVNGSVTVQITPYDAAADQETTVTVADQTYAGSALTPTPVVTALGKTLTEGVDYTVSYENNNAAGTGVAVITFMGNYTGSIRANFTIAEPEKVAETTDNASTENGTTVTNGGATAATTTTVAAAATTTTAVATTTTTSNRAANATTAATTVNNNNNDDTDDTLTEDDTTIIEDEDTAASDSIQDDSDSDETTEIDDEDSAKAMGLGGWSLADVLLMIVILLEALAMMIAYLRQEDKKLLNLVSIPVALVAIIALFVGQNFYGDMMISDNWTVAYAILFAIQTVLTYFVNKKQEAREDA